MERLSRHEDVKRALHQTTPGEAEGKHESRARRLGAAGAILFGNFYTGLVSLGVVSIIVGLAVQTPMTSFIGWIYILVRAPYRVGDRIKIGEATGDVIEVGYLDTTLWEFGGQYLSTDHPSGRLIKFPNSKVNAAPDQVLFPKSNAR